MNPQYWWPDDAATHMDNGRCGRCGHSKAYHKHHSTKGLHGGQCEVNNPLGEICNCRAFVHPKKRGKQGSYDYR